MTLNRDLMIQARESLKGRWGLAVGGSAVYLILIILIQCVPKIGWIAHLILGGPLLLGCSVFFLSFSRNKDPQIAQLFDGFNRFGHALIAYILVTLFIFLWTLLLIIPGIIAYLSYSQVFFILADNPQMEGKEALRQSKALMKGNRLKLFFLFWRFFGWFLLGILSMGIGFFWIMPYLGTTLAWFYKDLQPDNRSESMERPDLPPLHPNA